MIRPHADSTYPPDWPEISRATKEAAGWRCIRCGHPAGDSRRAGSLDLVSGAAPFQGAPIVTLAPCDERCTHPRDGKLRVLTVHHLDGDKANCRWWNLAALCQVCHLQVQAKVRMDQAYLYPHSEWFRPYAAGYYAATVLGQDLSHEEVLERVDELLRVGQPWLGEVVHG